VQKSREKCIISAMGHRIFAMLTVAALLTAGSGLVMAHHSFQAEFDISKPMTVKGTVTKVEWVNPHVYVHVDVADPQGKVTNWSFETLGPGRMRANGMSKQSFGIGKTITLKGYGARDGSKALGFLRQITFDDGHSVEVWLGDTDNP
jgi:hypothetical protein